MPINTLPVSTNWGMNNNMIGPGKTPIDKILPKNIIKPRLFQDVDLNPPSNLTCPNVASHLIDCPVCSNLHTKEKLLYIFLGAIIVIIFFVIKKTI
jgi:hypothetical protein